MKEMKRLLGGFDNEGYSPDTDSMLLMDLNDEKYLSLSHKAITSELVSVKFMETFSRICMKSVQRLKRNFQLLQYSTL